MARVKNMTQGNPYTLILSFAIPLMLGNVCQQLYTVADTAIVGKFVGVEALAAVGAAAWPVWFIPGILQGLSQGMTVLPTQQFGAGDLDGMNRSNAMTLLICGAAGILLMVVGLGISESLMILLNTTEDLLPDSLAYFRIMLYGTIPVTLYNVFACFLRAMGDGRTPLMSMLVASAVNIILDLVFILVFHWGVAGAAWATVISQVISCVPCVYALRRIPVIDFSRPVWKFDGRLMGRLLRIGAPLGILKLIIGVGGLIVQSVVNGFGVLLVAGYTAATRLEGVLDIAATSFGFAMVTYTGQNLGANRYDRIRLGTRAGSRMAVLIAALIAVVMFVFGKPILSLFISGEPEVQDQVLQIGYECLCVMSAALFIQYLLWVYRSILQGLGDTVTPMVSGIVEMIMRMIAVLFLPLMIGEKSVYFAEPAAWIGAVAVLITVYYIHASKFPKNVGTEEKKEESSVSQ